MQNLSIQFQIQNMHSIEINYKKLLFIWKIKKKRFINFKVCLFVYNYFMVK